MERKKRKSEQMNRQRSIKRLRKVAFHRKEAQWSGRNRKPSLTAMQAFSNGSFKLNMKMNEVVLNEDRARKIVQLIYQSVPSQEIVALLNKNGFRWSEKYRAWEFPNTAVGLKLALRIALLSLNAN